MCRVCFMPTGASTDLCGRHDGKRPSPRIVYRYRPPRNAGQLALRGAHCVIEGTGGDHALVRFVDRGGRRAPLRATVLRSDLERAA